MTLQDSKWIPHIDLVCDPKSSYSLQTIYLQEKRNEFLTSKHQISTFSVDQPYPRNKNPSKTKLRKWETTELWVMINSKVW
jgi:hypothetical protein